MPSQPTLLEVPKQPVPPPAREETQRARVARLVAEN